MSQIDLIDRLNEINCPTLATVADQDHGTPPELAKIIAANLPGAELKIIPGAAHIATIKQTEIYHRNMMDFYSRVAK